MSRGITFESAAMLISIVIPVYDSRVLEEIAERIEAVFAKLPEEHEIIFVDDFSPNPDVWPALVRITQKNRSVKAVQLTRNFGQHAATLCGLEESRGDYVITMDDDLQHSPEDIPRLLDLRDHDVVIAQLKNKQHSLFKRVTSRIKGLFDQIIIGKPGNINLSSFRMLSRVVVDGMLAAHSSHPFIPALIFHISKDVVGVEVEHHKRKAGRSGYNFVKLFRLFNDLIINNSSLVLRLVGHLGILFACISFIMVLVVMYKKLALGIQIQGWASLFAAIMLVGGLLLFGLGVVGEYLIRIIESSETRPSFFIRRRVAFETPDDIKNELASPSALRRGSEFF
jgi:dolichol-phosphate mannosyltransferase/undecaprenyl-phosphate 4-deoxy-4-formamido-L-arabinose transferase